MACIITYKNKQYTQKEFEQYFKEHFIEFAGEFIRTTPDVILPIGTSGSGKSTFIKSLPQENLVVIEPDAMRVEFTGDMNNKSKDKEIYEEAANRAIRAVRGEPNLKYGFTRLYRAENEKGVDSPAPDWVKENQQVKESQEASGRWFYKTYEEAKYHSDKFGGEISYVDIPTNKVEKYNAKENKFAGGYGKQGNEYFVTKEIAGDRKDLILKPKQVVFDTTNLTKEKRLPFIEAIKKAIPSANIQYKLMELNPELAKQRIKAQLERGENRANVPDSTIDRHAESYKQMLEDIKNEPISEYKELGSKQDIEGFKEFVKNDKLLNQTDNNDILQEYRDKQGDIEAGLQRFSSRHRGSYTISGQQSNGTHIPVQLSSNAEQNSNDTSNTKGNVKFDYASAINAPTLQAGIVQLLEATHNSLFNQPGFINSLRKVWGDGKPIDLYTGLEQVGLGNMVNDKISVSIHALATELMKAKKEVADPAYLKDRVLSMLSEEFIHGIAQKYLTSDKISEIYSELTPVEISKIKYAYNSTSGTNNDLSPFHIVNEYIRQTVQSLLEGKTSEESSALFNKSTGFIEFLKQILNDILNIYKKNPESVGSKTIDQIIKEIKNVAKKDGITFPIDDEITDNDLNDIELPCS